MTERELPVLSFTMDTNYGGVQVTVCGCGVLLFRGETAFRHIDQCPTMNEARGGEHNA